MPGDSRDLDDEDVISIELGVSRRKLMKQMSAAGLAGGAVGLAGCSGLRSGEPEPTEAPGNGNDNGNGNGGSGDSLPPALRVPVTPPPTADEMDLSNPQNAEREMVFVGIVVDEFQQTIIAGLNDGLNNIGWTGQFIAPQQHDTAGQIELFRSTIGRLEPGDVLAWPILDEEQYEGPIQEALENDLGVIGSNTNVYAGRTDEMLERFGQYIPYVGQQFIPAGVAITQEAIRRTREQIGEDEEIVALPTIIAPGSWALQRRVEGCRMALEAADNVRLLETLNTGEDLSQAISRIQDSYRANPDINLITCTAAVDTGAAGRFVENEGVEDEVVAVGFDTTPSIIEGIQNGTIEATADQDGFSQGYIAAQLAWEYMERGAPMKDYNTGVAVVDDSNIDFVAKRDGAIGDLINWQEENYDL
jgi:ABC-type sugar transport system substrate-binding protein